MAEQIVREDMEKLIQVPDAYVEAIAAGKRCLEAVGTADEAAVRETLAGELKEDVCSIDDLTAFTSSPDGEAVFSKGAAAVTKTAAEAAEANGEPNCLCDACQAGARILREAGEARSEMANIREESSLLQRECFACGSAGAAYLLLQPADEHDLEGMEEEAKLLAAFEEKEKLADRGLLVAARVDDWMRELAPWEAPQPSSNSLFGDSAPAFLEKLLSLIPALRTRYNLPEDYPVLLGGYSSAGFFSLWAPCRTDAFAAVAAASPSLWFQGFMKYQRSRTPRVKVLSLSLGDREKKARNEMMASCGNLMRQYHEQLSERIQPGTLVLEWNPGGHFGNNAKYTARAFYLAGEMLSRNAGKAL